MNRMNDRPIEEPKQTKSLGQMCEWETIPFGGHPGVRNLEVHNWRMWYAIRDMESIESRIGRGRIEIDGNVEVLEEGCKKGV